MSDTFVDWRNFHWINFVWQEVKRARGMKNCWIVGRQPRPESEGSQHICFNYVIEDKNARTCYNFRNDFGALVVICSFLMSHQQKEWKPSVATKWDESVNDSQTWDSNIWYHIKSIWARVSECEQETNRKGCLQLDVNNCPFGIGMDLCSRSIQNEWQHSNKHAV